MRTVAEVVVVLTLIIGFLKENSFIKAERKAWRFLRRILRKARDARKAEQDRERLNARYADEYETRRSSRSVKAAASGEKKRKSARDRVA